MLKLQNGFKQIHASCVNCGSVTCLSNKWRQVCWVWSHYIRLSL